MFFDEVLKRHYRTDNGKFRAGKPVPVLELADVDAPVTDKDKLRESYGRFLLGQTPPPLDIAVDPTGAKRLVSGKHRLAAARMAAVELVPVRYTATRETFGKSEPVADDVHVPSATWTPPKKPAKAKTFSETVSSTK